MKHIDLIFSSTTLLCLLCSIQQGWSLPFSDYAASINAVARQQGGPTFLALSSYEPRPGELNPVTLKFAEPILDGQFEGATIPLAPVSGGSGAYAGYITFEGEILSLDGVTFTGGPDESYTTVCMFLVEVESNDEVVSYEATNPFGLGMEGSATNAHGIGCTAAPAGGGGINGPPPLNADVQEV